MTPSIDAKTMFPLLGGRFVIVRAKAPSINKSTWDNGRLVSAEETETSRLAEPFSSLPFAGKFHVAEPARANGAESGSPTSTP